MPESWRSVVGYEGLYEVSDAGRVRSCDRVIPMPLGRGHRTHRGRILKPTPNPTGHLFVSLYNGTTAARVVVFVHVLVLEAFVGPCPPGLGGLHWNGDPGDNVPSNLRWGTQTENMEDARRHGTLPTGERAARARLSAEQVAAIRAEHARGGVTHGAIAERFGVNRSTVSYILRGDTWAG